MQCIVPSCGNTPNKEATGIYFHEFPSDERRSAWLKALGIQDAHQPDSAVVCSQHFLNVTESGQRQICPGAIPSTVLVCMICLETDSELLLMSKHKLLEAYEKLTGHSLCDLGNLRQTLCVQCAQTLRNLSRFREQSLRARSLMMDLVRKHGLITMRHLELMKHEEKLKGDFVTPAPEVDFYDSHMESVNENNQTPPGEVGNVIVKRELENSPMVEEEMEVFVPEAGGDDSGASDVFGGDASDDSIALQSRLLDEALCEALHRSSETGPAAPALALLKCEDDSSERWPDVTSPHNATDMDSVRKLIDCQDSKHTLVALPSRLTPDNEYEDTEEADTTQRSKRASATEEAEITQRSNLASATDSTRTDIRNCVVMLYDIFKNPYFEPLQNESQTRQAVRCCDSLNTDTACKDAQYRAASESEVAAAHNEPAVSALSDSEPSSSGNTSRTHTQKKSFTCDVCQLTFIRKSSLVNHINTHNKPYAFKISSHKRAQNNLSVKHIRTHTGEKLYACNICDVKCRYRSAIVLHMRTHTGEKPYACEICHYKFRLRSYLVTHLRTHTGEKPFACEICGYKFGRKSHLLMHMDTHTGVKPFACMVCGYKFGRKGNLVTHMRTHTGEKPYACEICQYKFVQRSQLVSHLRTHTGEKPFACKLCDFKSGYEISLARHMKTHTHW